MSSTRGVAIIGCGLIGTKRAGSLPDSCRLLAVHDTNEESARKLASSSGSDVAVRTAEEIVGNPDIDIVVVATSHASLAEVALAAVENRKHVLIEKPGARNASELAAVRDMSARNGVTVRVGFNHRFHPSMLLARDIIRSGIHGELLWLRGRYGHGGRVGYDREWRAVRAISGGGELLDQGSHLIDLTRFFFGDVMLAHSHLTTSFWDMEVEDNAFLQLNPTAGGTAWLHASWTEWKNTFSLEITLRRAKIDISGLGGSYGRESLTLFEMQPEMGPPPSRCWDWSEADTSWDLEMLDFLAGIDGAEPVGATIDDALATLGIIGEAYTA